MAITYLVNYDANGNQDVTLEFDSYNEASISGLRYTDAYHGLQWLTFGSVAIEALSTDDINNGYSGYVKIVAQNRSNDNTNMVFFIEQASTAFSDLTDYTMDMSILLLSNDWMNLWWQSGLISGTYMNNFNYGNTNYYRLESDAADAVGSASGTATNVTFQSGEGRNYAYFDGSGSKIDLGQSANMGIGGTGDFTVSAWIRPDTLNMGSGGQIFGTVVTGATSPQYAGFQFYIDNGVLKFMIGGNGYDTISYTLPAGLEYIWSHFAVSRSGTEVKMYMNGALVHTGTTSAVHDISTSHTGHLYAIGSYYSPYNNTWYTGFEGGIDEVDVWNRKLSDSEISEYYAGTNIVPPATVTIDQDVTAASIGDVLTATVDLQGGNLEYFAWELNGTVVAGGEGSPVVSLTVTEAMSEEPIVAAIRVDGNWSFSLEPYFPVLQSLVGHWSFDNGDAVADVGTNGVATGVDFITDSGRTVASFDASSGEKIHFGDVNEVDFGTGDFSVGAWVNFNSISTSAFVSPVVYKGLTSLANWNGYALSAYQGQMRFMIGGGNAWIRAEAPITTGAWHHVVGTRSGAVVKLYIDGSLVDTQTDSSTRDVSTHLPLTFGSINNGTEYNGLLDAKIDDVRIYSKALSGTEVSDLHTATTAAAPTPETTLIGHWSFDSDGSPSVGSDTFTLANGTTFASDSGRDAAYFPNNNSMMYASPKVSLASEFTISVWFKDLKDNSLSHASWLQLDAYSASGANGLPSSPNISNIAVNPSGYLGGFDGSNFQSSGHEMTQALYNGTGWHHLVATSDGSTIKYYVDAIQVGNAVTMAGSAGIQVINGWSNYARTFASYLDDLRVYSKALDLGEVQQLHDSTLPPATPIMVNGTYPLYLAESDANGHAGGNGTSHSHEFGGVTYYMPNGLTMDVDQFHGTYGLVLEHDMDDTSADAGSIDFSQAGTGTISFVSDAGRDAVKMDDNLYGSLHLDSDLDLGTGGWTLSTWFKNIRSAGTNHDGGRELFHWWGGSMSGPWVRFCAINSAGEIYNSDGTSTIRSTGYNIDANISDSSWHQMTVVYDGSSVISYYIDGSYVGETSGWSGHSLLDEINGTPNNTWFNSNVDSGGYKRSFSEYLSDFRAWNRTMDADEVAYWHTETTVEDSPAPAPSGGTVDLTVFSSDSYGDGWNNGSVLITDSNGDTVQSFTGPAGGVKHPAGLTETMTVTGGATYTYSVTPGNYPGEIAMTISDSDGNVLVTLSGISGTGTFDAPAAPAESSSYDWTHGGQLTNIVKFSRGVDTLGNPSYAYAKKEDDNTTTVFLTTDISDFAQFSSNATGATGIIGSPVCMEYGSGKLFMGTSTGNAYEIGFDGNTITSVLELHSMAGGESVREAKYDSIQNQWIFEAGEKIFTVVPGTTTAVERYVLPAGAKCMDIAAGDSGVAIIIKRADHSLAPIIATAGWTEISSEEAMVASLNSLGVADFNYNYVMDKWVAANASGQVLLADDLLQFLGGSGSPPPLGG